MNKTSIIVKDLVVKTQENTVLDGISFSLQQNQHLAVLGNAGSGKTALAKALAGKIHCNGKIDFDFSSEKNRVELVEPRYSFKNLCGISDFYYQQRFNSFDSEDAPTVYEELVKASLKDSKPTNNINYTLAILGIEELKKSPLIQLSSGEHKRFQLAKAMVNPPQMLILDTPYTGLDVASVEKLNNLLIDISKKGTQIILIPGTFPVPEFIKTIAFIENKKLSFFGKKEDFNTDECSKPATNFVYNTSLLPLSNETSDFETIVEMKNIHLNYGIHTIFTRS